MVQDLASHMYPRVRVPEIQCLRVSAPNHWTTKACIYGCKIYVVVKEFKK